MDSLQLLAMSVKIVYMADGKAQIEITPADLAEQSKPALNISNRDVAKGRLGKLRSVAMLLSIPPIHPVAFCLP